MDKWNWENFIRPIINQLKIKNGSMSHRITNKTNSKKFVDDLVITLFTEPMKIEDPVYGYCEAAKPELWFEQRYGDKLSINFLYELRNKQFEFKPGDIFGCFSNEIDIMPLKINFGEIENKIIGCELELTFTNRDNSFQGTFEDHSKKAIKVKTDLEIEPLVYLDYHKLIENKTKLAESLNSEIYDLDNVEEFEFGWKDGNMKSYKIGLK